jgi:hypothetical protein
MNDFTGIKKEPFIRIFVVAVIVLFLLIGSAAPQDWVHTYDGKSHGQDVSTAMTVDNEGNVIVTGYSYDYVTGFDFVTIKYFPSGQVNWINRYSPLQNQDQEDKALGIISDDAGSVYVTGYTTSPSSGADITTIKYTASGLQAWAVSFDSPGSSVEDKVFGIAEDRLGNIYVAGYSLIAANGSRIRVIKYDAASGEILWAKTFKGQGVGDDKAFGIAADSENNIIIIGQSKGNNPPTGSLDYVTLKYSPNGNLTWERRYNGPASADDIACAVAVDAGNNLLVTGKSMSSRRALSYDFATVKYNSSGVQQWVARYDGNAGGSDEAFGIAADDFGNIIVTGVSTCLGSGKDITTIKYNSAGLQLWVANFGGKKNLDDGVSSIGLFPGKDRIYVGGYVSNSPGLTNLTALEYDSGGNLLQYIIYPGGSTCNALAINKSNGDIHLAGYISNLSDDYIQMKFSAGKLTLNNVTTDGLSNNSAETSLSEKGETSLPPKFSLHQNYPNPFNPVTMIKFDVPQPSFVTVVIYDMLGRIVSAPVGEYLGAGSYEIEFDAGTLSSGTYFCEFSMPQYREVRKMLLTR